MIAVRDAITAAGANKNVAVGDVHNLAAGASAATVAVKAPGELDAPVASLDPPRVPSGPRKITPKRTKLGLT